MMFLQFFAWGAWFATLALAMGNHGLGDFIFIVSTAAGEGEGAHEETS